MQEMKCDRCGEGMTIHEFVNNSVSYTVLGFKYMFRFCNTCLNIIKEGLE